MWRKSIVSSRQNKEATGFKNISEYIIMKKRGEKYGKRGEVYILSADGKTTIHAVRWIPEDGKYEAILQITHGMIEFVERYRPFADFLTKNAFMVVGHDHLGHGDSVASKDDWGYFAENPSDTVIADMHTLRTMASERKSGCSLFYDGTQYGILYASEIPHRLQ